MTCSQPPMPPDLFAEIAQINKYFLEAASAAVWMMERGHKPRLIASPLHQGEFWQMWMGCERGLWFWEI